MGTAHLHGKVCEQGGILLLVLRDLNELSMCLLHDVVHRALSGLKHFDSGLVELLRVLSAQDKSQ